MGFKSFMGKLGKGALKVGKVAVPIALAATGVGLPAAVAASAALNAADKKASGGTWKQSLLAGGIGAGTSLIPGAGGVGGAVGGNVAKAGLKQVATGLAKGAATNFATGTATGLATGQGVKGALKSGASAAGSGGMGGGGLAQAAKTVGKNVATNVGGHYAAKGLQKAGVPGELAATGGNVFSNYLGNQFNKPAVTPTSLVQGNYPTGGGFGASPRPGGATFGGVSTGGLPTTTGKTFPTGAAGGGAIPSGSNPIPNTMGLPPATTKGGQIPSGANPIPNTMGQPQQPVTGQAPPTGGGVQQPPANGTQAQTWAQKYGPLIAQGGGIVAGGIAGKIATGMAQKRSPEEQAALDAAQASAGQLGRFGGQAWQQGQKLQQAPGQYFQTLLSGNRAAMSQALAGPTAQITGNYRGAARGLDQMGVRGAARDVASADLNRDRVSKIAGLATGVQPYAAEQLTSMGQQQQALAPGMLSASGQLQSNLLSQGAGNRAYARQEGERTAAAVGGLARDVGEVVFQPKQQPATSNVPGQGQGGTPQAPANSQTKAPTTKAPGGTATPPPVAPVMTTQPTRPTQPINGNQAWRGVTPPFAMPMPAGGSRYGYQ